MGFGGFSWKRAIGISSMKSKISRGIGVPLTKSGRQRKIGKLLTDVIGGPAASVISCVASGSSAVRKNKQNGNTSDVEVDVAEATKNLIYKK